MVVEWETKAIDVRGYHHWPLMFTLTIFWWQYSCKGFVYDAVICLFNDYKPNLCRACGYPILIDPILRYLVHREQCITLQRWVRSSISRRRSTKASTKIQTLYRGHQIRRQLQVMKRFGRRLQVLWEARPFRQKFQKKLQMLRRIQQWGRNCLAKHRAKIGMCRFLGADGRAVGDY